MSKLKQGFKRPYWAQFGKNHFGGHNYVRITESGTGGVHAPTSAEDNDGRGTVPTAGHVDRDQLARPLCPRKKQDEERSVAHLRRRWWRRGRDGAQVARRSS